MGSGVSVMHGMHGMFHPSEVEHIWVGLSVLGASAAIDSYSLAVAYRALADNAAAKAMSMQAGPGAYCLPRHRVPFNSRDEGSNCVG